MIMTSQTPVLPTSLLQTTSSSFKDCYNRTILLRGINLSASSKLPSGRASHQPDNFWEEGESGDLTYVGRPFPLWNSQYTETDQEYEERRGENGWYTSRWEDSADCHLTRLKGWGFNVLRYVVTWEALEHYGPGKYDYEFIDYTIAILRKCKQYGFKVYIDPHQDIWSRFSGGSGAPYWTLIACGLNPRHFTQTATAILHHEYAHPDPAHLPAMVWSTGYNRFAAQTLFTLFFGGKTYAPKSIIDDMNIQDYLQSHFVEAFGVLADKIREADAEHNFGLLDECVIGWDSLNEPFAGFCGLKNLETDSTAHGASLKKGLQPTVLQNLNLGMGAKQVIENWDFGSFGPKRAGEVEVDPKGVRMWITAEEAGEVEGISSRWGWRRSPQWKLGSCIWALHGVWSPDSSQILQPTYFSTTSTDEPASFLRDFWLPHFESYATRIRASHPDAILFVQPPVFEQPIPIPETILQGRACLSTHYYDGLTLVTRHWNWFNADALGLIRGNYRWTWQAVKIGSRAIRNSLQSQLSILKSDAALLSSTTTAPAYPTLIGEIGTPMDMDNKRSYGLPYADEKDGDAFKGDFSEQIKALDASLNALDGDNCLSAAIWCYAVGNGHQWGDEWNLEDLSLWSADDAEKVEEGDLEQVPEEGDGMDDGVSGSKARLLVSSGPDSNLNPNPPVAIIPSLVSSNMSSTLTLGMSDSPSRFFQTPTSSQSERVLKFLSSGARAVTAFSRPYPTATVGRPVNVRFDVETGEFRMGVLVSAATAGLMIEEEEVGYRPLAQVSRGKVENDNMVLMPTEVFLPYVHYASTDIMRICSRRRMGKHDAGPSMTPPLPISPSSAVAPETRTKRQPYLHLSPPGEQGHDGDDTTSSSPTTPTTPHSITHYSTASTLALPSSTDCRPFPASTPLPLLSDAAYSAANINTDSDIFSLDMDPIVEVSHGTTVVEGQCLKWYYALPRVDEGEVLYEICVRRGMNKGPAGGMVEKDENAEVGEEEVGERPTCWDVVEKCWRSVVG